VLNTEGELSNLLHIGILGTVFLSLAQYDKAKEYQEKALHIKIQIGDKMEKPPRTET